MSLQYRVPENIDIEDKVIGPLTLRQFMFLFAAFAVTAILYKIINPENLFIFAFIISPVWLIAGMLGFFKPNDRPMDVMFASAISFFVKPRQRIWSREVQEAGNRKQEIGNKDKSKEIVAKEPPARSQLENLARIVDNQGWGKEGIDNNAKRVISPGTETKEDTTLIDPLEDKVRGKKGMVLEYLEKIAEHHKPKMATEPSVSDLATVDPKKDFKYYSDQMQLADDDIIQMAKNYTGNKEAKK